MRKLFNKLSADAAKSTSSIQTCASDKKMVSPLTRFSSNDSGNIAILFALMVVPFMGAVGLSIDYGRAVSAKTRLQANVDSAVLAAGREFQVSGSMKEATAKASRTFNALMSRHSHASLTSNSINQATNTLNLVATTSIQTAFASVMGYKKIDIQVSSSATLAQGGLDKNLEVAISLDVTGSMYGSKIADLKTASKDLINILIQDNPGEFTSRLALVPFSSAVRPSKKLLARVRKKTRNGNAKGNKKRTLPVKLKFTNRWGSRWTWRLSDCIGERHGRHAFTDKKPKGRHYMSPVYTSSGSCKPLAKVVPLSNDKTMLKNHVDSFQASGYTSGHLGTAWAWYMLSQKWRSILPAGSKPGKYNDDDVMKVAILMTDGQYNTQYTKKGINDYYVRDSSPNGTSSYQAAKLCEAMKDKNITVYTVGFEVNRSSTRQMLKDCATQPWQLHYFVADDGGELQKAFREIAFKLVQLRLSK